MPASTGSLSLRSDNRHQLPSDPFVAKDALAYSLSSHWLGDMVNFSDHRPGNMPRKQKSGLDKPTRWNKFGEWPRIYFIFKESTLISYCKRGAIERVTVIAISRVTS